MKNVLVVQGGGRAKGNTAQLVSSFVKGAEDAGHKVETISLMKNEVKGCLGCCLPEDAAIQMGSRRLIRQIIWQKHMSLAEKSMGSWGL